MRTFILIYFCIINVFFSYSQDRHIDYDSFFKKGKFDYRNDQMKLNIANYLSKNEKYFNLNFIDKVEYYKNQYITNYGKVDLIKVALSAKAPVILNPMFLIIINHKKKELINVNIDNYYLIKSSKKQIGKSIAGLISFRGNLQLIIYDFSENQFRNYNISIINNDDDCIQYIPNSFVLKNIDINNDGWLDIIMKIRVNVYCNDINEESDKPLKKRTIIKRLIYNPSKEMYISVSDFAFSK